LQDFKGLTRSVSPVQQVHGVLEEMELPGKQAQDEAARGIFVVTSLKKNLLGQSQLRLPLTDSHWQLAASLAIGQFCLLAKY
jgi:hypothetical protein